MTAWISTTDRAVLADSLILDDVAVESGDRASRTVDVLDAMLIHADAGWVGFSGAAADAVGDVLRTIARDADALAEAGQSCRTAFTVASSTIRPLQERSDALVDEAWTALGEYHAAVDRRSDAGVAVDRAEWALRSAEARNIDGDLDEEVRRARSALWSAEIERTAAQRALDAVVDRLDDHDAEFRRLQDQVDDADRYLSRRLDEIEVGTAAICAADIPGVGHPAATVLDLIDGALIAIDDPRAASTVAELRRSRDALAERFGIVLDQRDHVIDRERVIAHGTSEDVKQFFLDVVAEDAGLDMDEWDPALGLDHNESFVEAAYEYYADLFLSAPDQFQWAGMAALVGPGFFAGFRDLETFADLLGAADSLPGPVKAVVPGLDNAALGGAITADELRWYQEKLLGMQREIFVDMVPAHAAFAEIGMRGIEAMFADDPTGHGAETIAAWQQIADGSAAGDSDLVAAGNAALLYREQAHVIQDDYDEMKSRPITGLPVTYMMTAIGQASIPGTRTFGEVFPLSVSVTQTIDSPLKWGPLDIDVPWVDEPTGVAGTATVETPLPDGNIANLGDRLRLIDDDTLPAYQALLEEHREELIAELERPVSERADDFAIGGRIDDIVVDTVTAFDIDIDLELTYD